MRQARLLSEDEQEKVLEYLGRRSGWRDRLMFLLSIDAGLKAKEIAALDWSMATHRDGALAEEITGLEQVSKGRSGAISMSRRLSETFAAYADGKILIGRVVLSKRGKPMSAQVIVNFFWLLYQELGLSGCSSHSGRRTAITRWNNKASAVGGSVYDVQMIAGHSSPQTTKRYVEPRHPAEVVRRKLVE